MSGMIVHGRVPKAGKVLVIYSEPEIRRILEVNLAHANLEVMLAESGAEALELIRRDKLDVVILDQELLDMESDDVYRRIKEFSSDVPVVFIGSWLKKGNTTSKADEIKVSYVAKPFDPKEVVALVQLHLIHKERQNNLQDIDSLQLAMEINLKEAREALKNIERIVASLLATAPPELKDSFDRLANEVQEMAVLCNRSLYLAHDFNRRLEIQQEGLLEKELEKESHS
jgi:DNA-binding response OmpR family regulator